MRLRRLLGLAAVGGALAYAYRKHGGTLDVESIKKLANELVASLRQHVPGAVPRAGEAGEPQAPPVHDPRAPSYGAYTPKSPNGGR